MNVFEIAGPKEFQLKNLRIWRSRGTGLSARLIHAQNPIIKPIAALVEIALVLGSMEAQQFPFPERRGLVKPQIDIAAHVNRLWITVQKGYQRAPRLLGHLSKHSIHPSMARVGIVPVRQEHHGRSPAQKLLAHAGSIQFAVHKVPGFILFKPQERQMSLG